MCTSFAGRLARLRLNLRLLEIDYLNIEFEVVGRVEMELLWRSSSIEIVLMTLSSLAGLYWTLPGYTKFYPVEQVFT